ncbi:MAG: class I SAM-dependent methyltransferase [Chloroflexi bacterium]|nr:class I SAM-dependent methyltransferase [Chloroflexota bacterium]
MRAPSCTTSSTTGRTIAPRPRGFANSWRLAIRTPGTLLDVACGTGSHLVHLRDWYAVEGLDLNADLLKVAARRLPEVTLHEADMRDFDLGRTFDVVTCLFSSIGYVETTGGLSRAVEAMARHLAPSGVLIVEPWLSPNTFDAGRLGRLIVVERSDLQAVRMNGSRVKGNLSIMDYHYLVTRPGQVEHLTESHSLGLFTDDEYRSAFEHAGLSVEHDADGLMGRGLWIGQRGRATA